jgi:UDP-N-acetylmuramoylalanine--D-glutamate ligase
MKLADLTAARILILGLGREGMATYQFLRAQFPEKVLGLADRLPIEQLDAQAQRAIGADRALITHLGEGYLASLKAYDVVIRSPGVPLITPAIAEAARAGVRITSHIEIFLANCIGTTIGVTGTKGKSTTASLIHAILSGGGLDSHLVGNIGVPPLSELRTIGPHSYAVIELSSYQLDGIGRSPRIAVLLNIVPEHLDLHGGFENYVRAKQNITRFQSGEDVLIYNAMYPIPCEIAQSTAARRLGFAFEQAAGVTTFVQANEIICRDAEGLGWAAWDRLSSLSSLVKPVGENRNDRLENRSHAVSETILPADDIALPGRFNLQNVMAAVTVGRVLGVDREAVAAAVRAFKPLAYRLEPVGTFGGITFYDDPLATIPQATIAALDALGSGVATVLLGGFDRGVDMDGLAQRLRHSQVRTLILFPPSGTRIWQAVEREYGSACALPRSFFATDMRTAVSLAYENTPKGRICLHSPASPSFGLFKDYAERGDLFRYYVRELGSSDL